MDVYGILQTEKGPLGKENVSGVERTLRHTCNRYFFGATCWFLVLTCFHCVCTAGEFGPGESDGASRPTR